MRSRTRDTGTLLLLALAEESTPQLVKEFDNCFYPIVKRYVLKRRLTLNQMARGVSLPNVHLEGERLEETAHQTAVIACARARAAAAEFDPARGSAEAWVLRNAAYAYREVAANLADSRRRLRAAPTDDAALQDEIDSRHEAPDTADVVVARERLHSLFELLDETERNVVILCRRDGYTYAQAAEILFGDASKTSRVGRVLRLALFKLNQSPSNNPEGEE